MRQNHRAADLLVGMTAVYAQFHMHFDGFIELGLAGLHGQIQRLFDIEQRIAVKQLLAVDIFLSMFHWSFLL